MDIEQNTSLLITCEHGGNKIPAEFRHMFKDCQPILESHEGWDPGALDTARCISEQCDVPLFHEEISRLVIEQNRSLHSPDLFSRFTKNCPDSIKNRLIETIYIPYHQAIESLISDQLSRQKKVVHFSIHSFTPVLNGTIRDTDIGILYDSSRSGEKQVCSSLRVHFTKQLPHLIVKENYPYRGTDDGLTCALRRNYSDDCYAGIEIEINQKLIVQSNQPFRHLQCSIAKGISASITDQLE